MSDLLVCASRSQYFGDDIQARCARCGGPIVYRPHAPVDAVKVCMPCAGIMLDQSSGPIEVDVTNETLTEAALYLSRTKGVQ